MKFQIQIDDDVAAIYQDYAAARPGQTVEQVLAIQLQRYVAADPRLRILLILPEERARLEELTSRMPITTVADLIARVATLAELSIGRIRFRWTPTQFRQLKERATHWGIPVGTYAERVVRQIEEQFFDETPQPRTAAPPKETIRIPEEPPPAAPPAPVHPEPRAAELADKAAAAAQQMAAAIGSAMVTPSSRRPPAGIRRG